MHIKNAKMQNKDIVDFTEEANKVMKVILLDQQKLLIGYNGID